MHVFVFWLSNWKDDNKFVQPYSHASSISWMTHSVKDFIIDVLFTYFVFKSILNPESEFLINTFSLFEIAHAQY